MKEEKDPKDSEPRLAIDQFLEGMDDFFYDMKYEIPWDILDRSKLRERLVRRADQSSEKTLLTMYMVKNKEGKYFRFKGRDGYGETWVSDIKKGRLYSKISPARAIVSFFANTWPKYGIPDLVEMHILKEVVLDESERVNKVIQKKKEEKAKYEMKVKQQEIERAERELETAKKKLENLKNHA